MGMMKMTDRKPKFILQLSTTIPIETKEHVATMFEIVFDVLHKLSKLNLISPINSTISGESLTETADHPIDSHGPELRADGFGDMHFVQTVCK